LHLEAKAQAALDAAQDQQIRSRKAIRQISKSYHPYDLETGQARNAAMVEESLKKEFKELLEVATEAELSETSIKRIQKAKRVMVQMVATITFFFLTIRCKVEALRLEEEVENVVLKQLIPAIYLDLVSNKGNNSQEGRAMKERSRLMLALVNDSNGPLADLSTTCLSEIEKVALECAQLFQRSSSCVEGRNGHLSLWHHSWHRISERKLAALTTVHNYFTRRPDGTTPAERFFNKKPENLFSWLLEHVDLPARPAAKRPPPESDPFLKLAL